MKNMLKSTAIIGALLIVLGATATVATAQDTTKMSSKIKRTATKVGHATAKVAVKAESAVVDKVYSGKAGPNGETVYINKNDRYYYVNSKGTKVPIKKSALHNKPTS